MSVSVEEWKEPVVSVRQPVKWVARDPWHKVKNYVLATFPIIQWIHKYNLTWAIYDAIAGITVGIVIVPQSMSYANTAGLQPQFGLYSSFIGLFLYPLFATSKDISIGPVAVMSQQTKTVVSKAIDKLNAQGNHNYDDEQGKAKIAAALSLLCGGICLGVGLIRFGFLFEYISMPGVLGFMTGSAYTIIIGQLFNLMGTSKTGDSTPYCQDSSRKSAGFCQTIRWLKQLPDSDYNAAFGIISLFALFVMQYGCAYLAKRDSRRRLFWFYLGTLKQAIVVIVATCISWAICRGSRVDGVSDSDQNFPIKLLGTVPRGLQDKGAFPVSKEVADAIGSDLAISVVVLVLEHISISRSFGRINGYRINSNQELIAIGVSNMVGHMFEAYPNTGSFSRTALKAKCGVRTPIASMWTGACVLVAIYGLTDAFYWIPKATISAIVINAVCDLFASWRSTWKMWIVSPVELIIFLVDVFLCIFVTLEAGIYMCVAATLFFTLLKQTFPLGQFLGKVRYETVPHPTLVKSENVSESGSRSVETKDHLFDPKVTTVNETEVQSSEKSDSASEQKEDQKHGSNEDAYHLPVPKVSALPTSGVKWWPLTHDNINTSVNIEPPPPGILVYRFRESLTYQNVNWQMERIGDYVRKNTRRNVDNSKVPKLGDRTWNDGLPRNLKVDHSVVDERPVLRAIVFDMSASPNIDFTASQYLWDLMQELTKYASQPVEFHFAGILSEWSRRALVNTGIGGSSDNQQALLAELSEVRSDDKPLQDEENQLSSETPAKVPIVDTHNIFFHFDIPDLVLI